MDHLAHTVRLRFPRSLVSACGLIALGLLASIVAFPGAAHAAEPARTFVGRPVGEVLDELRAQGLTFIYNTRLVPPRLRVQQEPQARSGLDLATEILAAHGLHASQAAPGVYAIVAAGPAAPPPRTADAPVAQTSEASVEEIVVHASRYRLTADLASSEAVLTHENITTMPRLGDETLRAVQRLPGFATNGFSSLGSVRGGEPNEAAIVLDGLRLYEPFHLKNFLSPISVLDSRIVDSMEVYSGGFPVIHGERMSAIIEASSVAPPPTRYYEAGLSLFHANALASTPFADGRGRALVSGRRSNASELAQFSEEEIGKPAYFDAFGKVEYEASDATRLSFNMLAAGDRITAFKDSGREEARAEYRNVYSWGTLDHDWSDGSSTRVILSYTDVNNERAGEVNDPGRRVGQVRDIRNFHVIGLRADHRFDLLGLDHRAGFEVRRLWGRYDYASDVTFGGGFPFPDSPGLQLQRTAQPKPDGFESAMWWDARFALGNRWTLLAGLRLDTQTYDHSGDAEQIAPRVNLLYDLSATTRLRASWGRFFQAQGINELQVEDGIERFHPAQHADHLILSLDQQLAMGLDLRIEAYRKNYRDLYPRFENLFSPLALLPETQLDRVMVDPDTARAEGVEAMLRWESQGPWRAWLAYAWSQTRDRIDGRDVPRRWDQKHAVSLGVTWASGPWTATVTNNYHTGWPTTRLSLVTTPAGEQQFVIGERNADRVDYYNSLDLRVTRTFLLPRGALDVFVEATNALSRENPCCIEYSITRNEDGSAELAESGDKWLPLVPSIGVLWRY
jgi:outer membrane receptor protein involved in Fe transport